jgi:hypothetical protein
MSTQSFPAATKGLIENSRSTLVNIINAGRKSTHNTLSTCDSLFKTGTDTLALAPAAVANELRDNLVSIEGQLTLIANLLTQNVADNTAAAANRIAGNAAFAVDSFERVFDLRVMQALDHLGIPADQMVRRLANRLEALATEIDRLLQIVQGAQAAPVAGRKTSIADKSRTRKPRKAAARGRKHAA